MSEDLKEDTDQKTESGPLRVVLASDPLWRVLLRYLCFAVMVLVPVFQLALSIPTAHDGVFAAMAFAVVALLVEQFPPRKSSRFNLRSGEVTVREGTLFFDGRSLVRLAEVREAQRLPGGKAPGWLGVKVEPQHGNSGTGVHLLLRGWRRRLVFRTPGDEAALSLVQRLGLGPGQRLTTVDAGAFRPNAFWVLFVLAVGWLTALRLFWDIKFFSTVSEYPYLLFALTIPAHAIFRQVFHRKITVGADGLRIRLLGRTRFVSFSDIARITHKPRSLALILTSGEVVVLVNQGSDKRPDPIDRGALVASVLVPAFEAHSKRTTEERYRAVLARGGRKIEDWHQQLDRLAKEEGDPYRKITLHTDVLWQIAEDPSTPADCRAAAAVVLRAKQGEEASARLQDVARSLASDNLAKALTGAAEAEGEEDYVEVLELASDQQNASRRL